ncbi:MAG TPA: hypothetical protein VF736_11645 [Pyrinomonadaceae bacterium]
MYKPQPQPVVLQRKSALPARDPRPAPRPPAAAQAPARKTPSAQGVVQPMFPARANRAAGTHAGTIQMMLRRRIPTEDDVPQSSSSHTPPVQTPSTSSVQTTTTTLLEFNEETAANFFQSTGGADIKSEDKTFHMLSGDSRVWAVASGGTMRREYEALVEAGKAGMKTVLAGELTKVRLCMGARDVVQDAFPMLWIKGAISSKSKATQFKGALKNHKANRTTLGCLEVMKAAAQKVDLQDFQVLLDPSTGELVVNDPRGHTAARHDSLILKKVAEWEKALSEDSGATHSGSVSSSALSPWARCKSPSFAPSEEECRRLFEQGELGIYHPSALQQDFNFDEEMRIRAGERGPFRSKHGTEFVFVRKMATGNFYFCASYF